MPIQYSPEVREARDGFLSVLKKAKLEIAEARERWSNLSIKEIEKASTLEETIAAFRSAPWGTTAKALAIIKWVKMCADDKETARAWKTTLRRYHWDWYYDSPEEWKQGMNQVLECVRNAKTTEELNQLGEKIGWHFFGEIYDIYSKER